MSIYLLIAVSLHINLDKMHIYLLHLGCRRCFMSVISRDEELSRMLRRTQTLKLEDDVEFRKFLISWRSVLEMTDQEIANKLLVSRPTISRWMSGQTLPHRAMRKSLLSWMTGELKHRQKQRQSSHQEKELAVG